MKKTYSLFLIIFATLFFAQVASPKLQDVKNVDYLNYSYKYLDKDFKIKIPNEIYQASIKEHKFIPVRVIGKKYSDSLSVVLMAEFANWEQARLAQFKIGYTWERLGNHLLISENDARKLAQKYGEKFPYNFSVWIRNPENHDAYLTQFFQNLRKEVIELTGKNEIQKLSISKLMDEANRNSPDRIKKYLATAYLREHGIEPPKDFKLGVSCGKKDCCQTRVPD